jgi:hypothetical protein
MSTTTATVSEPVLKNLDQLIPDLEALYKDMHAHPELSMQETLTAGLAADGLRPAGYEVTTGVGKTGVVGLLHKRPWSDRDAGRRHGCPAHRGSNGSSLCQQHQDEGPRGEDLASGAHVRSRHARRLPRRRDHGARASAGGVARDSVGGVSTGRGDRGRRPGDDR